MAVGKGKATTTEKPTRGAKEVGPNERTERPSAERPRPPEPFEECGPTGGYGGAGTDDEAKDKD